MGARLLTVLHYVSNYLFNLKYFKHSKYAGLSIFSSAQHMATGNILIILLQLQVQEFPEVSRISRRDYDEILKRSKFAS